MFSRRKTPSDPNARRLVVHIGDHKTGTTSIQTAFARGDVTLNGADVFYPGNVAHNYLRRHVRAYHAGTDGDKSAEAVEMFEQLARRIRRKGAQYSLLSAEALEETPPKALRKVLETFFAKSVDETWVVAYVRPHAGRLAASFVERTKIGLPTASLESFATESIAARKFHYHTRFSTWRKAFGDRFVLRPAIRSQLTERSAVHDLVRHGFGREDFSVAPTGAANESLSLPDLMRLKALHGALREVPQTVRHSIGWEFLRLTGVRPGPNDAARVYLCRALMDQIHDAYLKDAKAMDRDFFDGQPLLQTDLEEARAKAPVEALSVDPADHLSASEMRSVALMADMVASLVQSDAEDWTKFLRQKRVS